MAVDNVVIVGGGLGGLFTGALLARNGVRVVVLEKNSTAGGGLQSFARGGVMFDTGMHVMGGWRPSGTLDRLCRYLGIRESLEIEDIPDSCMDTVTSIADGVTYEISSGKSGFIEGLSRYFPDQRSNLEKYIAAIERIADSFDLFNLRPYNNSPAMFVDDEAVIPADAFIAKYISDNRLRSLLAYINGLYAGEAGRTPAYVHALISALYLKGASRFIGNSSQLVDALVNVIKSAGGDVLCNHRVDSVAIGPDKVMTDVACDNGKHFHASQFVWAAHPAALLSIVPHGAFTKAYINRVSNVRPTCSAFSLFIEFKPGTFKYIDHTCYLHDDMLDSWNLKGVDKCGVPRGFMYMTPPVKGQGEFTETMLVTALMGFNQVESWSSTEHSNRPEEYTAWKEQVARGIIEKIALVHPEIHDCIKKVHTASPLTVRDYYNVPEGAVYGFAKDCNNLMESQLPILTKVKNLFLTGQCVNLHGICGVPLTALTTAEALLYPKTILQDL